MLINPGTVGDAIREVAITEQVYSGLQRWDGGMRIEQTRPMEELERDNCRRPRANCSELILRLAEHCRNGDEPGNAHPRVTFGIE